MRSVIKIIDAAVDFVADLIFALLEINSKVMETLMKSIVYICQQLFYIIVTIFNGATFALSDLITFLLEVGHGVLVIVDIIGSSILYVLRITSQVYETFFCFIFALYSLSSSIYKSLVKQVILLAETLQNVAALIVSSCALLLQSVPLFAATLFKGSLLLIMQITQIVINNAFHIVRYIHDLFACFLRITYSTICDLPTDFYIGSLLLFILYFLSKKAWQTYRRNGPPRYIFLVPRLFMNMIHHITIKLHFYSQWIFSLFTYTQIDEDGDDLLAVDDVAENSTNDTTLNHLEEATNANTPSSSRYLQRKPLISLRKEENEEKCEISARSLKAELERERDRHLCIVCQDKSKNIIILPCRHLCLCSACYRNIVVTTKVCPLCRHEIYDSMHVFF